MRELLSGTSWKRTLLSTKITAEEAQSILDQYTVTATPTKKRKYPQVKKVS